MKKLLTLITLLLITLNLFAQVAVRVGVANAFPQPSGNDTVKTFFFPDNKTTPVNQMNRIRTGIFDSLTFAHSVIDRSLGYIAYNGTLNPNGFINGISALMINTALGYTPLQTETDPLFNTKFLSKTTNDLVEGTTNKYDKIVSLTAGNRISITGTYPNFTIAYIEPTIHYNSRTLNTNFTISNDFQATVFYTVTCTVTNPALAGSSVANVFLEYSQNAGSTWQSVTQQTPSSSVGLSVTLSLTAGQTGVIAGVIPKAALVRLRSTTTGTGTEAIVGSGQENF